MDTITTQSVGDLSALIPSFERSLRAANKSPKTIATYGEAASQLLAFLRVSGMPTEAAKIGREHVESFIERLVATKAAATANNRYRALCALFNFLVDFGEITVSPMAKMKPPKVPEVPVPVLTDDDLRRLLAACEGKAPEDRRDMAVLRLFLDSGMRLSELTNLKVGDLDLDARVAIVMGKGRRPRLSIRGQDGKRPRPLPPSAGSGLRRGHERCAVARGARTDGHSWYPGPHRTPGQAGWSRRRPRPLVPPRLRPRLAEGRWQRDRSDAAGRMA